MLKRDFFKGKRVTVFGLGLNSGGMGTVEFLVRHGVREVIVTDIKTKEDLAPSLKQLRAYKEVQFVLGQHRPEDFTRVDLIIKNPIIPWNNEYVKMAEKAGIPIEMDSSLFFQFLPKVPVLGVTGTKGKTTTALLLAHLLRSARYPVVPVGTGQIGVLDQLDQVNADSVVVCELSSWRLSALHRIKRSPSLGIITNMFPDHLNYYRSMEAYIHDKEALFAYQREDDIGIYNAANAITRTMAERMPGKKYFFGPEGGTHAFWRDDTLVLVIEEEEAVLVHPGMKLIGEHNRENILAAALGARIAGLERAEIEEGLATFSGVRHRLEWVREVGGIRYVNDTAATIPDAALAAFAAVPGPLIVLAGGADKELPLETLADALLSRTKGVVLFRGEATEKLLRLMKMRSPERHIPVATNMAEALERARALAEPGDTILLSPGAASFGLFQNEFDRGDQFCALVKALPEVA